MGTKYKIATGHDELLINMDEIDPQPEGKPITPTRRSYAPSGAIIDDGLYVELVWSTLPNATVYQALLAQFGLDAAKQADVTVVVRDDTLADVRMNGVAIRPSRFDNTLEWSDYMLRDVIILVRNLEATA